MKVFDQIEDMLCDELEQIAKKKELTSSSLDVIDKAVDVIKDIRTVHAMEQEYPEGYSNNGYSTGYFQRYPYYMYDEMPQGNSYARGRNAERDARGRYSSEGYSRDSMSEELRQMMNRASTDKVRDAIRKALDSMSM
jgi:hypothetical protein